MGVKGPALIFYFSISVVFTGTSERVFMCTFRGLKEEERRVRCAFKMWRGICGKEKSCKSGGGGGKGGGRRKAQ